MRKKHAMTLTELLVTLVVIGITVALTIPTMIVKNESRGLKESFKKNFSELATATQMVRKDNEGTLVNAFSYLSDLRNKYISYLSVLKSCDNSKTQQCWHDNKKWNEFSGNPIDSSPTTPGLMLNNGILIVFEDYFSSSCDSTGKSNTIKNYSNLPNICSNIMIDVNGFKLPNTIGKDIFYIWILSDSIIPWGTQRDDAVVGSIASSETCTSINGGWGCAGKVLQNIDY